MLEAFSKDVELQNLKNTSVVGDIEPEQLPVATTIFLWHKESKELSLGRQQSIKQDNGLKHCSRSAVQSKNWIQNLKLGLCT